MNNFLTKINICILAIPLLSGILSYSIAGELKPQKISPQRIVSLCPPATEQIFILGHGNKIIACTEFCVRPLEAQKKEKIGSLINLNLEKIISLSPDLIITSCHTKPQIIEQLQNLNFKIFSYDSPNDFDELFTKFLTLACELNESEKASLIIKSAKEKIMIIRNITEKSNNKPKAVMQIGAKPLFLVGNELLPSQFLTYSSANNILNEQKSGVYSREMILEKNPDFIFIVLSGIIAEEEKKQYFKFKSISAVRNSQLHILDPYEICSPNPVELPQTLAKIAKIIHPEKAQEIENALKENAEAQ